MLKIRLMRHCVVLFVFSCLGSMQGSGLRLAMEAEARAKAVGGEVQNPLTMAAVASIAFDDLGLPRVDSEDLPGCRQDDVDILIVENDDPNVLRVVSVGTEDLESSGGRARGVLSASSVSSNNSTLSSSGQRRRSIEDDEQQVAQDEPCCTCYCCCWVLKCFNRTS